jgi:hypothetical protein
VLGEEGTEGGGSGPARLPRGGKRGLVPASGRHRPGRGGHGRAVPCDR